jgi:hypothetical protein
MIRAEFPTCLSMTRQALARENRLTLFRILPDGNLPLPISEKAK